MKVLIRFILLFITVLYSASGVFAQEDSTAKESDSLKNEALIANTKYLQRLDSIKIADSLKRAALESELSSLKTTDNLKKQELLNELEAIKQAEKDALAQKIRRIDSLKQFVTGFPISPFTDTICYVYAKLGPFSPQARAHNVEERIKELEDDVLFNIDSLKVYESEQTVDLLYNDVIVLSITDRDALWMGESTVGLANKYREAIIKSVKAHRKATSVQTLLKEIGLAILVVIFVVVLIKYINKFYKWVLLKIYKGRHTWVKGVRIRNYELFTAQSQIGAMKFAINAIRWLVIAILIYLMLPVLFSIFPWTKNVAGTLFGYVLDPLKKIFSGIWNYLPDLFTVIVIWIVFRYVNKGVKFLRDEVRSGALNLPGFYPDWATPTYQIIRILLFAFMIIVMFPYLPGSDSPAFQGVSVFLGVLFTFGSSGSLSNIVAGLVLTYMRAFKIGDRVKIGEVMGDIIEKTLLVTRVRTIKNEDITIPNSTVMNSHTINYTSASKRYGLIVHSTVTIGYDVPWRKVHELLINAAADTELIQQYPKPFVLQTSLDDYYVSYQINAYTKQPGKQAVIYSSLHQNIQDKFNEAGVEIMSPHYQTLRDGNATTIPSDYLPDDYVPPPFNVKTDKKD
ncbi:MAG: mechanosensitive ion channel family protein [Flavipsychrobacter sp.]